MRVPPIQYKIQHGIKSYTFEVFSDIGSLLYGLGTNEVNLIHIKIKSGLDAGSILKKLCLPCTDGRGMKRCMGEWKRSKWMGQWVQEGMECLLTGWMMMDRDTKMGQLYSYMVKRTQTRGLNPVWQKAAQMQKTSR